MSDAIEGGTVPPHSLDQELAPPAFWPTLREALRGPIGRAVLLLAVPTVLEMVLESVFAVVDVFWVAHLGADAVATVGITESLLSLVFAVGQGVSLSRSD